MKDFKDIDLRLCHSCGTCVSVCPNKSISMIDGLPRLTKDCTFCGLCFDSCPGIEFNYPEFNEIVFGSSAVDSDIGYYRSIYVGYAINKIVRQKGASGGAVTALLLGLLRRKEIAGAIVVDMHSEYPWIPRAKIAASEEEILDAAQSKYSMISLNQALTELHGLKGNVAFVGLPCHIHGLRKLQKLGWKDIKKIKYCIGVFCGFNMEQRATGFLIKKFRVKHEDIKKLEYRGGDWPGGFLLRTKQGKRYFLHKHIYNYLNLMFVPKRCLVCPDLTNEFADVAVGDAWNKSFGYPGWSTIVTRTQKGQEIIDSAVAANDIKINISDKEAIKDGHAHLILYKKKGIFVRKRFLGLYPDFGLSIPIMNAKERVFNIIFFYLISFMKAKFVIKSLEYVPFNSVGLLGKYMRSAINCFSRQKKPHITYRENNGLFHRIRMEYKYLRIREWDFQDIGAHWDSVDDYDDINKETYSYFRRFIDGYKLSNLPGHSYILDICSRTGNGSIFFWEKGVLSRVTCADFSKKMQSICARRLEELGIPFDNKLIDSLPLPFKEREFDAILCFETLEHVPDPGIFIKELSRAIKDKGKIILTTPNVLWRPIHSLAAILKFHHSEGPCRFISRARLQKYINEAGLSVIKEKTTVLIPMGPGFLTKLGELLEQKFSRSLMHILGLRQVLICSKE